MFGGNWKVQGSLAAAILTGIAGISQGGVIFTDGFGDADRNNDGVTDGATAVVTNAADVGIRFYGIEGSSPPPKPTFSVRDDTAGIGNGNALFAEARGSGSEWMGVLPSQVSLGANVGDKMILSMRFRIDGTSPHGVPTATTGTFRFGLYRDGDSELGTGGFGTSDGDFDGATAPGAADDAGIFARIPIGSTVATDARIFEEAGNNGDIMAGTGVDADVMASGSLSINDALAHTLTLTFERTADGVLGTLAVDGASLSGTELTSAGINTTTFDYLAFNNAGVDFDYLIDSVQLETVAAIPEPTLGLIGLGGLAMFRRVRRGAARRL